MSSDAAVSDLHTPGPAAGLDIDAEKLAKIARKMRHPVLMRFFLFWKLPLGFMAGLRVKTLDSKRCQTTVPYGWRTQNPFRSTYFAAQAMAAELSTGALAMAATELSPGSVAMLIVGMDAQFVKKASAKTTFTCEMGDEIFRAVALAMESGEAQTVTAETVGRTPDGTIVSNFSFNWSFRRRSKS